MTSNMRRWVHYGLVIATIICGLGSLFALVAMGATRWTTPLNVLALVLIFLAVKTHGRDGRPPTQSGDDHK